MYVTKLDNGKSLRFKTPEEIKAAIRNLQCLYAAAMEDELRSRVNERLNSFMRDGVEYVGWEMIYSILAKHYAVLSDALIKIKVGRLMGAIIRVGAYTGGQVVFDFCCVECFAPAPTFQRVSFHEPDCKARIRPGYRHFIFSRASVLANRNKFSELEDVRNIGPIVKADYEIVAKALCW